ncbi:MAG TPA: AbrB/MazE/SpoVT family DNA-binding domain-containing protein [Syntrophomonas wolfei]|jgi:AbrB family looped-hinge helix DNA binding protein|uniref:AbrB/MazE/SpoVT family DNA-binding domain-containing protein n=2 Tax=Syntrophomonas wolfei TaxID=863 RepID=A0A354YW70_9FIRM|nr:AbrB/MazE/SpoVT family DNA-binding domain-containing protein [Syntrophomonas wolfei]HBK53590.1 AbrB/MazE/SpoVT family DNA-binding domain-containing protein [Syntrophomonas wolfei]
MLTVMGAIKVTQKGQVVIPAEFRKKYGIKAPGHVLLAEREGHLVIMPMPDDPVAGARGMLKPKQPLAVSCAAFKKEEMMLEGEDNE